MSMADSAEPMWAAFAMEHIEIAETRALLARLLESVESGRRDGGVADSRIRLGAATMAAW